MMNRYFQTANRVSQTLSEITFFKYGLPVITILGVVILAYFGFKGIVKHQTILLFPFRQELGTIMTPMETQRFFGPIQGKSAVFMGIIYLLTSILAAVTLGPISFYMWFKIKQ